MRDSHGMRDWLILLPLLAFLAVFALTYPAAIVNADEAKYIRQANAFAHGEVMVQRRDPVTGNVHEHRPSDYPVGTSLLLTPLVAAGGWAWAFWMPALALALTFAFTVLLLRAAQRPPWFALLILLFPPALVMGRVATSDVASAAVVALGWWLFWLGTRERRWWLCAGLVAGLSLLLRESNALLFAPLFAGAMLRRDKGWLWLLVGGLVGVSVRLLLSWAVFGDALFVKDAGFGFSVAAIVHNAPIYGLALLVFVPGGLIFAAAYRGLRAPEVMATVAIFVLFYSAYDYSGEVSGLAKRLILGPRFFIPLLPVIAFAMAESAPRVFGNVASRPLVNKWLKPVVLLASTAAVLVVSLAFSSWTASQGALQAAITRHVPAGSSVVTNPAATEKFISELQGYSAVADYRGMTPAQAASLHGGYLVFVQRSDSNYWIDDTQRTDSFMTAIPTEVILDEQVSTTDRLRILRVVKGP